jgi:hypothetical protein
VEISGDTPRYEAIVAVPARDERERIGDCLRALCLQQGRTRHAVLLLLNNTSDGTADVVRRMIPTLPRPVHVVEHAFAASKANAGQARRLAMAWAADLIKENGVLLTTDADGRVAPDWMETNVAALRQGADAVCGRAVIDVEEAALIPTHLHTEEDRVCAYGALLDEIHALFDPDPADPWPRHTEHSGASIAVRKHFYVRAGGIPAVPTGEDRKFLQNLRCVDARIRHAPDVSVTVSGRIVGRAAGGMADTIRRRMETADIFLDDRLESARACARRACTRQRLRRLWMAHHHGPGLSRSLAMTVLKRNFSFLELTTETLLYWLNLPYFGTLWASVEESSAALRRAPLKPAQLDAQTHIAETILARGYAARTATREAGAPAAPYPADNTSNR